MVNGAEALRTFGSKRAIIDDWGKGWVKYSSEICVRNGDLAIILIFNLCQSILFLTGFEIKYLSNVLVEPLGAQFTMNISIVPVIVTGHMVENISHTRLINLREQRPDKASMNQLREVCAYVSRT